MSGLQYNLRVRSHSTSLPSIVKNDHVSRPLLKGILDGNLLCHFEAQPTTVQAEMTKQIGAEVSLVLKDLLPLQDVW